MKSIILFKSLTEIIFSLRGKRWFTFILLSVAVTARGQNSDNEWQITKNKKKFSTGWVSEHSTVDASIGVFYCNLKPLNTQLETTYAKHLIENVSTLGISIKPILEVSRKFKFDSHFSYQYILPREYPFSDSLNYKFQGYMAGFDIGKALYKSCRFDLLVGIGFNFGRFKLAKTDLSIENKELNYTNPFFAPKIYIEPKIIVWRICLSGKCEYLFDISGNGWKAKDSKLPSIAKASATGLFLQASIGWFILSKEQRKKNAR